MNNFPRAFNQTLGLEGGYINDPADPGRETKFGLSKRAYPGLDIAHLTVSQARVIYYHDYWLKLRLDQIGSGIIAAEIFDTAVNMGRHVAVAVAQKAVNFLGDHLTEDGIIGPKTVGALNRWAHRDEKALFVCLNGFQFMRYYNLMKKNLGLRRFARGWTKRIQQYQGEKA